MSNTGRKTPAMTTANWHQHIATEEASTPDMDTHGHRYPNDLIEQWRNEAIEHLQNIADSDDEAELHGQEWLAEATQHWAIVDNDGENITVEWETGKHSWAWVESHHIIGTEAACRLIKRAH